MGISNEIQSLAKAIDAMTLDELLSSSSHADLPMAGGDHDTLKGWAERLGVCRSSYVFKGVMSQMLDTGLASRVRGCVKCGSGKRPIELIHCPTLAKKIAER